MNTFNKNILFKGAATALVTPFGEDGGIDYRAFGNLIESQIAGGIDGLVVCGTTGEGSTLSDEEFRSAIRFSCEKAAGRVPIIAGCGSNDTSHAVEKSRYACEVGADGLLIVTPYYNKASEKGLIRHFTAIADASTKPVILYNVPSRTGCNITLPVYRELSKHENIVAVKEASGNLSSIAQIAAELSDSLAIYSGNDDQILPTLSLGGLGVISVLSNIMPKETHNICEYFWSGRIDDAQKLQLGLLHLINSLFIEVNPIPVKTACGLLGICSDKMRLPLCEMDEGHRDVLIRSLKRAELIK